MLDTVNSARREHIVAEFRDVYAAYFSDIYILQKLNLSFKAGSVTGIIGPNGAGKSTVLKTMMGFLRPSSGEVLIDGKSTREVASHDMALMGVGYVPQSRSLFLDLSVEDNLLLGCWAIRRDKPKVKRAIDRVLALFPMLDSVRAKPAGALSGGQRRFLEISRSLLLEPRLILFDEPTAMIAPKYATQVYETIGSLAKDGIAVVLVDQNVRPCIQVSDQIYVLELGKKTMEGSSAFFQTDDAVRKEIGRWLEVSGG